VIVALAAWNYWQSYTATVEVARSSANQSYSKDLVYRRWASIHGGVYAPITPETPPNPYLSNIPERDIKTPSGKKLTLINPAYMTRQAHEIGKKDFGMIGHITSLKPIRPENAPDEWEKNALQAFEKGKKEESSVEQFGGETYLRFMRPLFTEFGCLKCHAIQGYKVGDIRGGISVSVPWAPFRNVLWAQLRFIILAYSLIWVIGISGLYLGRKRLQKYLSESKRTGEELQQSHAMIVKLTAQVPGVVYQYRLYPDGRSSFPFASPGMNNIYEVTPEDVREDATPVFGHLHPDDYDRIVADIQESARTLQPFHCEFRVVLPRQGVRWRLSDALPERMEDGGTLWHGIISDITDRKNAEDERQCLSERLQRAEKMESLGTLAGGVAHDLNNVLGIIVGYSEMILDQVDKSSPIRHGLENVMNGGLKAAAIVEDLLTLARRGVPGRNILNLNNIVADCKKSPEFASLASHHPAVKIITDLELDLLNISGSSVHLGKSLYNLISNASEAMPKGGGTITIKTTNQYLDKPIQGYDQIRGGDYVVLSVFDTGEGIPDVDLKRIFEPFYTKKVMGRSGTGLGLAVVWGTVKDHNGYINVQSEEGKGSTFTLYFPVTREDITAEYIAVSISEYLGKGESILVVDDVKEQRDLAASLLGTLNYSVTNVSSGEEAVEYLKEHDVDLMVLDMIMDPGMDGLDTYKSILEFRPKQKAIIVSGFSESDRVKTAEGLGAGAYVRKPYIKEKLGMAVRKELDRK